MTYNKEIGKRLKEARKKRKLIQETVAKKFDLDGTSISKYETGVNAPDIEFLKNFAEYLEVNINWLLFGEPPMFKTSEIEKDIEGLFLRLLASIKESRGAPSPGLPPSINGSLEELAEPTPENYITLLDYMIKYPDARRDILLNFYVIVKPGIDKREKVPE